VTASSLSAIPSDARIASSVRVSRPGASNRQRRLEPAANATVTFPGNLTPLPLYWPGASSAQRSSLDIKSSRLQRSLAPHRRGDMSEDKESGGPSASSPTVWASVPKQGQPKEAGRRRGCATVTDKTLAAQRADPVRRGARRWSDRPVSRRDRSRTSPFTQTDATSPAPNPYQPRLPSCASATYRKHFGRRTTARQADNYRRVLPSPGNARFPRGRAVVLTGRFASPLQRRNGWRRRGGLLRICSCRRGRSSSA
jgi:hypothetical protein